MWFMMCTFATAQIKCRYSMSQTNIITICFIRIYQYILFILCRDLFFFYATNWMRIFLTAIGYYLNNLFNSYIIFLFLFLLRLFEHKFQILNANKYTFKATLLILSFLMGICFGFNVSKHTFYEFGFVFFLLIILINSLLGCLASTRNPMKVSEHISVRSKWNGTKCKVRGQACDFLFIDFV